MDKGKIAPPPNGEAINKIILLEGDSVKYKCIEEFEIQRVDDDGFEIENSQFTIEKGSAWELIGCSEKYDEYDLVQMDGNKYGHMTINKASLDCYFELIK